MANIHTCAELARLQRQYELVLRVWGELELPLHNAPLETAAGQIALLHRKQQLLVARNGAGKRLADHKQICPVCKSTSAKS